MTPSIERVVPPRTLAIRCRSPVYSLLRFYLRVAIQRERRSATGLFERFGASVVDEMALVQAEPLMQKPTFANTPIVSEKQTGMCRPHWLLVFDAVIFVFLFVRTSTCLPGYSTRPGRVALVQFAKL
jgi:hypothetical protein